MGLFSQLLLLPLAPVRGVVWVADALTEEAERQLGDVGAVRAQLAALATAYDRGEITAADYDAEEERLLRQMRQPVRRLDSED